MGLLKSTNGRCLPRLSARRAAAPLLVAVIVAGALPASDAFARFVDLRITTTAVQSMQETWSVNCLADGGPVTGSRSEQLTLRAGSAGRFFLYAAHKGGLRLAGAPISSSGTAVRTSTPPAECGPAAPEKCGERAVRFEVIPGLLERPDGRERGLALATTLASTSDPYPDCGGGSPSVLGPPPSDLLGGPSPFGPRKARPPGRYVYAPLPRAVRIGCSRRRFVVHGRAREVQRTVDTSRETVLNFTIVLSRVGCLGR